MSDDSDWGDVLTGKSRDHLARKARRGGRAPRYGESASPAASGAEESSDEEDLLYHDADVGDISDVDYI